MLGPFHLQHMRQPARRAGLVVAALLAALAFAAPAAAQCQLCPTEKDAATDAGKSFRPLRIAVTANLDFSRVASGEIGGAVIIDPVTGARALSGDVVDLGGMMLSGEATITGEPGQVVHIDMPREIELEADDGRTARVTHVETSLTPAPRIGMDGVLTFRFGGRLRVGPDDDGNYRGRIPINVEYEVR